MEEQSEKLYDVAQHSHDILYQADTIFPLTIFPDTVTIDREKLSIAYRYFLGLLP